MKRMKAASILIIISICFGVYMGVRSPYLFGSFASEQYAEQGYFLAREKRFDEAAVYLRKAINLNPDDRQALFSCKQLYRFHVANAPDNEKIIELCSFVIDRSPGRTDAYEYLMIAYIQSNEVEMALKTVQQLVRQNPDEPKAYGVEALAFNNLGEHDKAVRSLNNSIKLDPSNAWYYVFRGGEFSSLKQYHKALEDYNKALSLNPNSAVDYGINFGFLKQHLQYSGLLAGNPEVHFASAKMKLEPVP